MFIKQLALVSQTHRLTTSELALTAAALQKQVTRDFGPIWNIQATIDVFTDMHNIPVGYWPIVVSDTIDVTGAEGYHWSENNHIPYSLVKFDESWQLTCSHEMCEMLADPYGNKTQTSDSIVSGQGRVNYLVEVCDPCEDASFGYPVNGILLSDFYTPNFFDPVNNSSVRYSFTGAITHPKQVLKNGYLTWFDPASSKWFQANYFGASLVVDEITAKMLHSNEPLRCRVDRVTPNPNKHDHLAAVLNSYQQNNAVFTRSVQGYQENLIRTINQFTRKPGI